MTPPGLGRRLLHNSAALTLGRGLVALSRLVIAALVVRVAGPESFAAYLLLLSLLSIAEWLTDFGSTEIAVREICRDPPQRGDWLRAVMLARMVQAPVAAVALVLLLWLMDYPPALLHAGAVAAGSLLFSAAAGVYRVVFKATLTMAREMLAEVLSVLLMIPLLWLVLQRGGDLADLMLCHVASRAAFLLLCMALCRSGEMGAWRGTAGLAGLSRLLRSAWPIGCIGLLVAVYEALDVLMLSKLGQPVELAYLSAAQRIIWPALMALSAISGSLYPVMSTLWPAAPERFAVSCQAALETVLTLAGLAAAVAFAGAEFFLGLLGPALVAGAPVMRLMAVLLFVKAVASALGPLLYVVQAQRGALVMIACALVAKAAAMAVMVTHFGYLGVAVTAVLAEAAFAAAPTVWLLSRRSSWRLQWRMPLRIALLTAATAGLAHGLGDGGGVWSAGLALVLFVPLAMALGVISRARLGVFAAAGPA